MSVIPHQCSAYCRGQRHAFVFGVGKLSKGQERELFTTFAEQHGVTFVHCEPAPEFVLPFGWGTVEGMHPDGTPFSRAECMDADMADSAFDNWLMVWEEPEAGGAAA